MLHPVAGYPIDALRASGALRSGRLYAARRFWRAAGPPPVMAVATARPKQSHAPTNPPTRSAKHRRRRRILAQPRLRWRASTPPGVQGKGETRKAPTGVRNRPRDARGRGKGRAKAEKPRRRTTVTAAARARAAAPSRSEATRPCAVVAVSFSCSAPSCLTIRCKPSWQHAGLGAIGASSAAIRPSDHGTRNRNFGVRSSPCLHPPPSRARNGQLQAASLLRRFLHPGTAGLLGLVAWPTPRDLRCAHPCQVIRGRTTRTHPPCAARDCRARALQEGLRCNVSCMIQATGKANNT